MSSNFGFLMPCAAAGQPDSDLCVKKVPLIWPVPIKNYNCNAFNRFHWLRNTILNKLFKHWSNNQRVKLLQCLDQKNITQRYAILYIQTVISPSHPGVGQLTPSNFIAVATATAALCCSIVPPFSRTLILFRLAMGHPEALQMFQKNAITLRKMFFLSDEEWKIPRVKTPTGNSHHNLLSILSFSWDGNKFIYFSELNPARAWMNKGSLIKAIYVFQIKFIKIEFSTVRNSGIAQERSKGVK